MHIGNKSVVKKNGGGGEKRGGCGKKVENSGKKVKNSGEKKNTSCGHERQVKMTTIKR